MRKRIFEIIEKAEENDVASKIYDVSMLAVIFISLIPIMTKENNDLLVNIDRICAYTFIIDYTLRWITADFKLQRKCSLLVYPFTPFAIIDVLAILPTFTPLSMAFRVLKILRVFRVLRVFKTLRYSKVSL